ncbi:glyoxylase-like metal-dependent hydrolase (beta-lactamase superfamily II) [Rhodovulum bhavnagarense]|uniref:Glyoxylase-like metal-dependent hydrolase (Beta-lactamase superfamily II) n=1 Tax=Rhodovulum bhavnagarense TaxID=992286 RepID=A0A4R2RBM2_9RHOB|nr:MBL fold metallo-hydrolase [Rhodovulum bhavnagarense]TCP60740.1 glyoxylase-like metal-dependent hydrolase (beta-lactamase superfamily II) [Rhodovulum bhavnagarense]
MRLMPILVALLPSAAPALAGPVIETQEVAPGVYALIGPTGQRDPENLGNNATFGLVVTAEWGAVLIDPGATWEGAATIHETVRQITDQPIEYVVNTGGQDHRWLGNDYWQAMGAMVIASKDAVADQQARASRQLSALNQLVGKGAEGTYPSHADITFEDSYRLAIGDAILHIVHPGPAHTPGDSFVWHPQSGTVFTGDIVYIERIAGVMEFSDPAAWIDSFNAMAALNPAHVVPGHGPVSDLATAARDTLDYLVNLRTRIGAHIEAGGDILGSVDVDQSAFSYLENFDQLAGRNAQEVYSRMEWE